MKVAKLVEDLKTLKLGFDRKAWTRKHLKKKATCSNCGAVVCAHTMKRHVKSYKCRRADAQ